MWTLFDMTSSEDWLAKWITQPYEGLANPWLRSSFELESIPGDPAFIYVNALGYFQLFINGKRVGRDEFAPHVGQYDKRTFAMTYDVTEYLQEGKNTIGFWLGNGWNIGGAGVNITPSVRAQLELRDGTGVTQTVVTDESWRAKPSYMTYTGEWRWGRGVERFNNEFNYAGFGYVYIPNVPQGEIHPETIKGYVISTDLEKASTFSTSDETLNEIYAMMEYTLEILMMGGYQVDCHSRERQGYGGDAYASLDTTLCLFRTDAFYRKWTQDWVDQQEPNGNLTYTSPSFLLMGFSTTKIHELTAKAQ